MKRRMMCADTSAEVLVCSSQQQEDDTRAHADHHGGGAPNSAVVRAKRSCGRGRGAFLPPGALPPSAVAAWAGGVFGVGAAAAAAAAAAAPPPLALLLHAAAELDHALQPSWHTVPTSSLRGYVSLTRCDRAALWAKFQQAAPTLLAPPSSPSSPASPASPAPSPAPVAAAAAAHDLVRLLLLEPGSLGGPAARPLACLTKFTLELPPWMAGWAARWGLGASREVRILLVTAYSSSSSSSSAAAAAGGGGDGGAGAGAGAAAPVPAWRVGVPLLPCLPADGGGA